MVVEGGGSLLGMKIVVVMEVVEAFGYGGS